MKITLAIIAIALSSCGVTYKGKYATYSATPAGTVIIEPHYAK